MKREKVLGIIPARFGSTRFPGKPLAQIKGRSLLQRVYENAKKCPHLDRVIIATDDDRIRSHALEFDADVIMTSSSCTSGTERCIEVITQHTDFSQYERIINIQGDEPLLESDVIKQVILALEEAPMSSAKKLLECEKRLRDPSVVKCVCDLNQKALLFSRGLAPRGVVYEHLGIYGFHRDFLLKLQTLPPTPMQLSEDLEQLKALEHGYSIKVPTVKSLSIGVDHPEDIREVEKLL
ncbi:MAG: 3-deoxy-manno-octulosonate cytidylyltransferase [Waddliaceae bacterium]